MNLSSRIAKGDYDKPKVELTYEYIEHETEKAALIKMPDEDESIWIPLSVIADIDLEGTMIEIHTWFAKKQGWI